MKIDSRLMTARRIALGILALAAGCRELPAQDDRIVPPSIPATYKAQLSTRLCVMPAVDGAPQAVENHQAFRMASGVTMLPGHPLPWMQNYHRDDGEWTIDATGRYTPFPGVAPADTFGLDFIVEEPTGRIVGTTDEVLLQFMPGAETFSVIPGSREPSGSPRPTLARLPRENLTLVSRGGIVRVLAGNTLSSWSEQDGLTKAGLRGFWKAFDLPGLKATFFADGGGKFAIRFDDGRWAPIALAAEKHDFIKDAVYAPGSQALLLNTNRRTAIVRVSSDASALQAPDVAMRPRSDQQLVAPFLPEGGQHILRNARNPSGSALWQKLTPEGWETVPGGDFEFRLEGKWVRTHPTVLGDGRFTVHSQGDLMLYDGARFRPLPDTGVAGIGHLPDVVSLPALGNALLNTELGLFELADDLTHATRPWPFITGGLPKPILTQAKLARQAVVLALDGVFAIDATDAVERVPGGERLKADFGASFLGEIPISGDLLFKANNALHLVVTERSERWGICQDTLSGKASVQ
ncbi:MAG: hypothetical protein EON93_02325 [Burkholderiales bacterium]|nr:MAG: hypothetical protein EON93_02325 [Burkholderiales bacterium]